MHFGHAIQRMVSKIGQYHSRNITAMLEKVSCGLEKAYAPINKGFPRG